MKHVYKYLESDDVLRLRVSHAAKWWEYLVDAKIVPAGPIHPDDILELITRSNFNARALFYGAQAAGAL